jgi:hypothetical protein
MGHRDSIYRLEGVIDLDDAFIGGKKVVNEELREKYQ